MFFVLVRNLLNSTTNYTVVLPQNNCFFFSGFYWSALFGILIVKTRFILLTLFFRFVKGNYNDVLSA